MCVFPSGPSQGIYHGEFTTWEYFSVKPTNPKLLGESPCSFKIAERKPLSLIFLDGGILDHAFGPPKKTKQKIVMWRKFFFPTTLVLEKMPLRTPPVATFRPNSCVFSWSEGKKKTLPRTQKLTTLWANEPGKFSSIYLLTEELFGTCSNPQNHKARPLTPWSSPTLRSPFGRDRFQPWQVGPAFKSLPWAVLPMARSKRNSMRRHGKGVSGILAGSRKKTGDFWLDPPKTL